MPENNPQTAIPLRFLPVLQELDRLGIDYAITGSLGLKMLGILDREVHDLDLVVSKDYCIELAQFEEKSSTNYENIADMEHHPYNILGEDVCFFVHPSIATQVITLPEGQFKVTKPEVTIGAKLEILFVRLKLESYDHETALKHLRDVQVFFEWRKAQHESLYP